MNILSKNSKNDGKAIAWAVETAYADITLKLAVEKCMQWQWLKGGQANKMKKIWIGFCIC